MSEDIKKMVLDLRNQVQSLTTKTAMDVEVIDELGLILVLLADFEKEQICPTCKGVRYIPNFDENPTLCPNCNGKGTREAWYAKQVYDLEIEIIGFKEQIADLIAENKRLKGQLSFRKELEEFGLGYYRDAVSAANKREQTALVEVADQQVLIELLESVMNCCSCQDIETRAALAAVKKLKEKK